MKNFEKFLERLDSRPYGGCDCEEFLKNVYQDRNYECPSYDCYVCLAKAMKYLNEEYVEPIKLTHDEYVILKSANPYYEKIGRNYSGELYFEGHGTYSFVQPFNYLFDFTKFEDDDYEIAKLIADYEKEHQDE